MHHPDLISCSMSRTLQKARAHNVTFCNVKEISQKPKRNPMEVPQDSPRWDVHHNFINSIVFLWDSKRLHMEFQWNSSGISKDFHWIPMGFLQESFRISIIFLSSSDDISLKLLSDFRRIPLGIDKDFYSLFMVFP